MKQPSPETGEKFKIHFSNLKMFLICAGMPNWTL